MRGATFAVQGAGQLDGNFNSRTSCEVRLYNNIYRTSISNFNSRTSCEVRPIATAEIPADNHFNSRTSCEVRLSLPTPRTGTTRFQLTHLLRGATFSQLFLLQFFCISTHAPLARCDLRRLCGGYGQKISTHAPLARCDRAPRRIGGPGHFNSRTSCEVRPQYIVVLSYRRHIIS